MTWLALGIASPHAKRKLVPLLRARGAFFETCIHPYAYLGRHNSIGEGAIIGGGFSMSVNVSLGIMSPFSAAAWAMM